MVIIEVVIVTYIIFALFSQEYIFLVLEEPKGAKVISSC